MARRARRRTFSQLSRFSRATRWVESSMACRMSDHSTQATVDSLRARAQRSDVWQARLSTMFKRRLQGLFNRSGYHVIQLPSGGMYESILPLATYAPWNSSADFRAVWAAVRNNTLVDIFRCWELWQLVEQSAKLSGSFIEVGVWRGGTGALIA